MRMGRGGARGKGPSGMCICGITLFAPFVLCACTQACPLCHADQNVDIIQDHPAQPGSSQDHSAPKRTRGLVPTLRKHRALAGQFSTSQMGRIPFATISLRVSEPNSPGQPNGCMARADMIAAELASEGRQDEEEGRDHEDDNERGHAESSVARYAQHG